MAVSDRRNEQILRTLKLFEIVVASRFGVTTLDCVAEFRGEVCSRTIRRDLASLELAGYIRGEGQGSKKTRWYSTNRVVYKQSA